MKKYANNFYTEYNVQIKYLMKLHKLLSTAKTVQGVKNIRNIIKEQVNEVEKAKFRLYY